MILVTTLSLALWLANRLFFALHLPQPISFHVLVRFTALIINQMIGVGFTVSKRMELLIYTTGFKIRRSGGLKYDRDPLYRSCTEVIDDN